MKKLIIIPAILILIACQPKPEKGPDHAQRVSNLYDAFAAGEVEAVMASFTDDIQWREAENFIYGSNGEALVGGDAVADGVFAKLGEEWEYWNLVDKTFHNVEGDKVLVTGRYQAKNKATGKELDAQFAHVLTLRDTLVSSFQQYTDTYQAQMAIKMDEMNDTDEVENEMEETSN